MKNAAKLVGITAIVTVIGFAMAACNNDPGDGGNSALNGTWVYPPEGKIVLNNGNFTISDNGVEGIKGTYSTSGNNITLTPTQISGAVFGAEGLAMGLSASRWYTQQQLRATVIQFLVSNGWSQSEAEARADSMYEIGLFETITGPYTLSGNTLTITMEGETITFTKQ